MEVCKHEKTRADFEFNSDLISCLPVELIAKFLVKLPIEEAIRTSLLSSKWRYKWVSMPDLVFKEDTIGFEEIIRFVDMVLSVHQGPILTFELDCDVKCDKALDRWVPILSQNGIKDLRLYFGFCANCTTPESIFSCHKLEHLEISECHIATPQCFQGLKLLRTLKLSYCYLMYITMEELISNCPLLEMLELSQFVQRGCLVIRAPNLRRLNIHGIFTDISLKTPKLISARIFFEAFPHGLKNDERESKILHVLSGLPNIEELELCEMFYEYLSMGPIPKKLPLTYHSLRKIVINLNSIYEKGVEVALCIVRSAPNLKIVHVRVTSQNIWEEERMTTEDLFKNLEIVKILGFEDTVSMLGFAKFLLSTASKLEKLIIDENDINKLEDGLTFVMKLASFSRLSSKAVILFNRHSRN